MPSYIRLFRLYDQLLSSIQKKNPIHSTTIHRLAKARHQGIIIHMVAIATKQTILAILGCKKRYFAASEVSQISFDKMCNM
jgi:hypothetical protein